MSIVRAATCAALVLVLAALVPCRAVRASAEAGCSERCACLSSDLAPSMWRTARQARRTASAFETGLLDKEALEAAQSQASRAVDAMRQLKTLCAEAGACNRAAKRQPCGCRIPRLHNHSQHALRVLDDAAVGALFGDSELAMSNLVTATERVMRSAERVARELAAFGTKRCRGRNRAVGAAAEQQQQHDVQRRAAAPGREGEARVS